MQKKLQKDSMIIRSNFINERTWKSWLFLFSSIFPYGIIYLQ
jgi:hypothetical protein